MPQIYSSTSQSERAKAHILKIYRFIIYTRSGYEVFCNLIGSLLTGY
jgi:hypothetical protein